MLKLLSGFSISTWLILALMLALGGASWRISSLKTSIVDRDNKIIAMTVNRDRWKTSAESLEGLVRKQNKSIENLAALGAAAKIRAEEAIKKARPIVEARRAQKNKAISTGIDLYTCDDAVARAKSDLAGSLL